MMNEKWIKYSYVCPSCDSLLEYTIKDTYTGVSKVTCICGGNAVQVSVEDATILPITTTKGPEMEATTQFLQTQIDELKAKLSNHSNCDYWKSENGRVQGQIIDIVNNIYNDNTDSFTVEEIAEELCQIIDYNPTKEIEFTATMTFTGRIDVPMSDLADFDLSDALSDAYVEINNGDIIIDSYDLEDVQEN